MPHLVLVDDDDLFRESLGLNLIDEGYQVISFGNGRDALDYLQNGGAGDVVLLDWRMPDLTGLEVLRRMRRAGITTPVIFLTVLSDDIYEEAALESGAVDFIDKSRRLPILLKRLELIGEGMPPAVDPDRWRAGSIRLGPLELRFDTNRVLWAGRTVDLTLTEFKIVRLLAEKAGQDVGYREIYDLVHGKDFIAGHGDQGYRANVRTFIKRIRNKFRNVDPSFDRIENYARFGYRWTAQK
jgi:two-component system response regulator ChvI